LDAVAVAGAATYGGPAGTTVRGAAGTMVGIDRGLAVGGSAVAGGVLVSVGEDGKQKG